MRAVLPLTLLILLGFAVIGGGWAREALGIEFSPESIRDAVLGLGVWAVPIYLALLTGRQFLLMPSWLLLSAGGLCFGPMLGSVLGAAGVLLAASMNFAVARAVKVGWIQQRTKEVSAWRRRFASAGPLMVGLVTAHPAGPMTPFHVGAGFSAMSWIAFGAAVGIGAPTRSAAYSFFGSTLLDMGSPRFYAATGILLCLSLLPLLHPSVRRRFLPRSQPPDEPSTARGAE